MTERICIVQYMVSLDDKKCLSCEAILNGLELIDDDVEAFDIILVKVNDIRVAKRYGINRMPAFVYFRQKFPGIYRGKGSLGMLM